MLLSLLFVLFASQLASALYVVSGIQAGTNAATRQRPFRQEITKFARSGAGWDLFVQSVAAIQARSQSDPLSWFGFAGVHGRPFQPWDGVQGVQQAGYAMHNSILFGAWHRAFLAAYEQLIWAEAQNIAGQYSGSQKQAYQAAAKSLRIPYWDWASAAPMPNVVTDATVTVNTPKGRKTIKNPLQTYRFRPHPNEQQFPVEDVVSVYPRTVRTPDANGNDQIASADDLLSQNAANIQDRVYLLLAQQTNYAVFSNTGYPADLRNGSFDSVEAIHNEVHALVGGLGQMAYIPYSAFDPIFFLHHANVDRLLALWSAINPSSYVIPLSSPYGSFTEQPGTVETVSTPLTPFHKDARGTFHTAASVRDTNALGYTYPEIVDWGVSPAQLANNVRAAVNALYNADGSVAKRSARATAAAAAARPMRIPSRVMGRRQAAAVSNSTGVPHEWLVNLSVERDQTKPFFIHFFLGHPPADPSRWKAADNVIVSQAVLSDTKSGQASRAVPALSQAPLTRALAKVSSVDSTDVAATVAFLRENLQFRLQGADGQVWDHSSVVNLRVQVVDQEVELNGQVDQFHRYGPPTAHPELQWGN